MSRADNPFFPFPPMENYVRYSLCFLPDYLTRTNTLLTEQSYFACDKHIHHVLSDFVQETFFSRMHLEAVISRQGCLKRPI